MPEMGRVTAFAVIAALCAVAVRRQAQEIAMLLALAGVAAILGYCVERLAEVKAVMESIMATAQLSPAVAAPVLKTVGVAILTRFGAEVCRDAGENGLAAAVELAGGTAALCLAAPLMRAVLDLIGELL